MLFERKKPLDLILETARKRSLTRQLNAFDLTTGCSVTGQPDLTVYAVGVDDDRHIVIHSAVPA